MERRLAAVMAADIVGYTRLSEIDEEGTLRRFGEIREDLIEPTISLYRGRVVKLMGDCVLAEFASVVDAVRCGVEIQSNMAADYAEGPIERRIQFRVGINLGDIVIEDNDIYGAGVNAAARLQELAEPGSVVISSTAHEHIDGKVQFGFTDMGELKVKNIRKPIRVYKVEFGIDPVTIVRQQSTCVLVDATEEEGKAAGRRNYWKYLNEDVLDKRTVSFFSLPELTQQNVVFNFDEFDTVIINTDCVNGDKVFGADESLLFFQYQGEKRQDAWFRSGKHPRLIIEHQGLRLIPTQRSYNALLGLREVVVSNLEPSFTALCGRTVRIVPRFRDHPLLQHLGTDDIIVGDHRRPDLRPFFGEPLPRWLGNDEGPQVGSVFEARRDSLFAGWFEEWESDWIPLLRAEGNQLAPENNATMLVKVVREQEYSSYRISPKHRRRGIIIATTMRLAALAPDELLKGLLETSYEDIRKYHDDVAKRRRFGNVMGRAAIFVSFVLSATLLIVVWNYLIVESSFEFVRLFAHALGLPLLVLLIVHLEAARSFSRRSFYAGSASQKMRYLFNSLLGRTREKLDSAAHG
ncbi:MAG: adenylate/guanylate cyclase domain-containing protein [Pseudomonadota bacterium]